MSRLITILLIIALSTSLYAKPSDSVHIIASKNGGMIQVGKFVFRVVAEEKVKEALKYMESKIKKFVDAYNGIDANAIIEEFDRELQIVIVEEFTADNKEYNLSEPIRLKLNLRQEAFVYLLGVNKDKSCLVFPNAHDRKNQYKADTNYSFPSNPNYELQSNAKGKEKFMLLTSTKEIVAFKSSRCATQKSIKALSQNSWVDSSYIVIDVK